MDGIIKEMAGPVYGVRGWMKLAGVLSIIQGAVLVFTLWGISICWIPIWMGVLLLSAADRAKKAFENEEEEDLRLSLTKIAKYFKVFGLFTLFMLIITVAAVIAAIFIPSMIRSRVM